MKIENQKKILAILKYLLFFLLFLILSKASINNLLFPFAVGLYFTLIWCNQKIYIIAPLFIISNLIINFNLVSVLSVLSVVLISCLILGIHLKYKKPIGIILFTFYTFFSQLGIVFINFYFTSTILIPFLTIVCSTIFMLICKEILTILLVKGLIYKLNLVEVVCSLVLLSVIAGGLSGLNVFGIDILKIFACLIILISSAVFNISTTILVASVIGIGELVTTGSTILIAPFILWALVVSCFKTQNKIFPSLAIIIVELGMGFYLNIYGVYTYLSLIPVLIAVAVFLCIPKSVISKIEEFCNLSSSNLAMKNVVNRSRENLCKRLYDLSDVFGEMDYVFRSMIKGGMTKEQVKSFLMQEVKEKVCSDCSEKNKCHRLCLEETSSVFDNLISGALERGKASLLDVPPFLTTRCGRVSNLVGSINQLCSQYKQYAGVMNNLDASRVLIAEQLLGVSKIMKNLASEVNKNISFDSVREQNIINELSYNNIVCSDAVIYEQNTNVVSTTLVVRKSDITKAKLVDIVSKVCKNKMVITNNVSSKNAGWNVLTLKTAPKYDAIFGTASCPKSTSSISGDCYSVIRIEQDKFLLALCDGMGSGEKAEKTSSLAIGLVENFYKAGFDNDIILSSINKLLSLNKDEIFSALDVCVIDTRLACADFIKMGAPNSYLKHKSTTEIITGGALPLGIVQDIEPMIVKRIITSGDFVYLFTDGITESFTSDEELEDFINNQVSLNPQQLAEELIQKALSFNGIARDDMTVIVAKIFEV